MRLLNGTAYNATTPPIDKYLSDTLKPRDKTYTIRPATSFQVLDTGNSTPPTLATLERLHTEPARTAGTHKAGATRHVVDTMMDTPSIWYSFTEPGLFNLSGVTSPSGCLPRRSAYVPAFNTTGYDHFPV